MKFMSSLDAKDRRLLLWSIAVAIGLAVIIGFVMPNENNSDNPMPSTYLSGQHGARAAYESLLRSGLQYRALGAAARRTGSYCRTRYRCHLCAPVHPRDRRLQRGTARLWSAAVASSPPDLWGGYLLPGGEAGTPKEFDFAACQLEPEGLDPLASSGEVWMVPEATWQVGNPAQRIQYSCAGQPAVVEYNYAKGHVVWWASSTPLENGSLARAANFDLLLNSIGPRDGHHFYWDESLHGDVRSDWSYISGPTVTLLWTGLILVSILIVFSFSRRSGPLRELPPPARCHAHRVPRGAGIALSQRRSFVHRRRHRMGAVPPIRPAPLRIAPGAGERRRTCRRDSPPLPEADRTLEADLAACEEAKLNEKIEPRAALKMIQLLHHHRQMLARSVKDR